MPAKTIGAVSRSSPESTAAVYDISQPGPSTTTPSPQSAKVTSGTSKLLWGYYPTIYNYV